jgi:hypothetical protein
MDQESEFIRQQMEETRASLTERLETLERQVVGTVQQATCAVTETVENVKEAVEETVGTVKETVSDTVETVKETFSLSRLVERHPCAMFSGSVAVGFVGGYFLASPRSRSTEGARGVSPSRFAAGAPGDGFAQPLTIREQACCHAAAPTERPWLEKMNTEFAPEINKLKGLAIGTLMGLVRDAITNSMNEEIGAYLRDVMDTMTTKLGGHPIRYPVLGRQGESPARQGPTGRSIPSEGRRQETIPVNS